MFGWFEGGLQGGVDATTAIKMWSKDDEATLEALFDANSLATFSQGHQAFESPTIRTYARAEQNPATNASVEFAQAADLSYRAPPNHARKWTEASHNEQLPPDGTGGFRKDSSFVPRGVQSRDFGLIEDAHATLFSAQPSTVALTSDGSTRYLAPEGKARALIDYRVNDSTRVDTDPPGEDVLYRKVEYSMRYHRIADSYLYADDQQVGHKSHLGVGSGGTNAPTYKYNLQDSTDVSKLRLEAHLTIQYQRTVTERVEVSVPCSENGTNETCSEIRERTSETTVHNEYTLTDTWDVSVYTFPAGEIEGYRVSAPAMEGAGQEVALTTDSRWAGYYLPTREEYVGTTWRFYTARDPRWDQLRLVNETGGYTISSSARPVQVYAFPAAGGPQAVRGDEQGSAAIVRQSWGPERAGVTTPETVQLAAMNSSWTDERGITAAHFGDMGQETAGSGVVTLRAVGLVNGMNRSVRWGEMAARERYESNLTMQKINQTDSGRLTVRIELVDHKGEPIDLSNGAVEDRRVSNSPDNPLDTGGYILVTWPGGSKLFEPDDGVVVTQVPNAGFIRARYNPLSWLDYSPTYTASSDKIKGKSPLLKLGYWRRLLLGLLVLGVLFGPFIYSARHLRSIVGIE